MASLEAGTYPTLAAVREAETEWFRERAYRFGEWEFRPSVCEVWDTTRETVVLLTPGQSWTLEELIKAWPESVLKLDKMNVQRLRAKLGAGVIESHVGSSRGYRFNPEAVFNAEAGHG